MPLRPRQSNNLARAAVVLSAGIASFAPLAFGVVHPISVIVTAAIAWIALTLHLIDRHRARRPLGVHGLLLPLLVGLLSCWARLLPVPRVVRQLLLGETMVETIDWIAPHVSADAQTYLAPVLALDPPQTALAALRLFTACAVGLVLVDRFRRRKYRRLGFRVLGLGAALTLLTSVGHRLLNTTMIWGLIPTFGVTPLAGPMVNPNHLARIFGLFAFLCGAHALSVRARTERLAFSALAILGSGAIFLTLSRGGMLAFGVGAVVFIGAWLSGRGDDEPVDWSWPQVTLQATAIVAFAGIVLMARDAVVREISSVTTLSVETSKMMLYEPALRLIRQRWLFGVGDGGFQAAFPAVLEPGEVGPLSVGHVENLPLQTLADHGVLLGGGLILLSAALGVLLLARLSARRRRPLIAVLVFFVVGDLFDFVVETGAGVFLVAFALAAAGAAMGDVGRRALPRGVGWAGAALGLVAWAALSPQVWVDARYATDRRIAQAKGDDAHLLPILERALARHPLDGQYAFLRAGLARRQRDLAGGLLWSNRALVLWPTHSGAHIEAARALAARGYADQALLEYRMALTSRPSNRKVIVDEIARRTTDVAKRLEAVPDGDDRSLFLTCDTFDRAGAPDDAGRCYAHALSRSDAPTLRRAAIRNALRRGDAARAQSLLESLRPWRGEDAALAAQAYALTHTDAAALARSDAWLEDNPDPRALLRWRIQTALALDDRARALADLKRLRGLTHRGRDLDWVDGFEAALQERSGNLSQALRLRRQITRRSPNAIGPLLQLARLELRLNMRLRAEKTVRRALRIAPDHAAARALLAEIGQRPGSASPGALPDPRRQPTSP